MKHYATPRDLLVDRTLWLAQRIVERVTQKNCTPDEYAQLAPYIEREFNRRRQELARKRKP